MSIAARSRGNSLLPSATRSWGPNESTASRWGHREADSRRAREGGSPNKKRAAGANCAPPKDPSATRAVGVSPVDEIAQRTRPVNSAALDFVRGGSQRKKAARARERGVVGHNASLRSACASAITTAYTKTPLRSQLRRHTACCSVAR